MTTIKAATCLPFAAVLALTACAVPPPTGPTVMALPAPGKSFEAFQAEDAGCRQYAAQSINYASPGQAATNAGVGSALIGTGIGAAAGALLGAAAGNAGVGAAIGAGAGLLGGSAVGANNAAVAGGSLQGAYNTAYTQCMYAHGNTVTAQPGYGGYGGYPGYGGGYGYGYPAY